MCEPTSPLDVLKSLRFSLSSISELHPKGSYAAEQARMMAKGIQRDIDWVIANLEAANEGKKNFGLTKF
jgi:hypothetical protein